MHRSADRPDLHRLSIAFRTMKTTPYRLFLALGLSFLAGTTPEGQSINRIEVTPYKEFFGATAGFPTPYVFNVRVDTVVR